MRPSEAARPPSPALRRGMAWIAAAMAALCLAGCKPPEPAPSAVKPVADDPLQVNTRIIVFKNQLQRDPFSAAARLGLGMALLDTANPRAAELELSKALELGMDPNTVLPVLARTWVQLGRAKELIATYGETQLTQPRADADLKATLGLAYANTGQAAKARAMAEAALKSDPDSARARVLQTQIALADRKTDDALRIIEDALASHPDSVDAWELKGDMLLMLRNDAKSATAAYERALALAPGLVPVHSKLISMALGDRDLKGAQGRLDELAKVARGSLPHRYFKARISAAGGDLKAAQAELQTAAAEYPKDLRTLLLSAEVDLRLGSLRTAMDFLNEAYTVAPGVTRTRHLLAQAHLRAGSPEKAQIVLEALVRPGSNDATALGLSAEAALQSGLTFVATRLFERAAAADPTNPRYKAVLAIARISKGEFEAGFSELESAAAADPTTYSDMALLSASLQTGNLEAALRAADRVAAKQPKRPTPQWVLGRLKLRAKKPDEARVHFERAATLDPAFVPAAIALASLDLQAQDVTKARGRFQSVLALNPNNLDATLALAEIQFRAGENPKLVTAALERAVELHRGQARPWLALIEHLQRIDDRSGALLAAQKAGGILTEDATILDALGRAQATAGDTAQALSTFHRASTLRPRAHEPHMRMADVYVARKEIDSALDSLKTAVRLRPDLLSAYVKQTELLTAKKDWKEAMRVARDVQKRFPADARGLHLEGLVLAAQAQWAPAITAYRSAMKKGESSELALQLHTALRASGKADEASQTASQWLAAHPKDNYFIGYLGEIALVNQDYAAAEGRFRSVLQNDPRSVDAMNNLAWVLLSQGKAGAVDTARKGLGLQPWRLDVADTLSSALAAEGQLQAAVENQKMVVVRAAGAPMMRLTLARLAVKAKDYPLARAELDKLSALGKGFAAQGEVWQLRQQLPP